MDRLRLARPDDAAAIAAIYAHGVRGVASFELDPPDADEMAARIAKVAGWAPWIVLERAGTVAGYAYATRHRERAGYQWTVETSVYVDPAHHRTGAGRTLYAALLPMIRAQGFHLALAGIVLPNPGSIALHEALGFTPLVVYREVGWKHGAWRDVGWWQLALDDGRAGEPAPPRPPAAMHDDPAWVAIVRATSTI